MIELTVLIPTYNRKTQLINTLRVLEKQSNQQFYVVISDNASNYDINSCLESFDKKFRDRIVLRRNVVNIGAEGNIGNLYLSVGTEWIWPITDDDYILEDAIEKIYENIRKYANSAWIKFPVSEKIRNELTKDIIIPSVEAFVDFFEKMNNKEFYSFGEVAYVGNIVYNYAKIVQSIGKIFKCAYSCLTASVVMLDSLLKGYSGTIVQEEIIRYNDNERKIPWDTQVVFFGVRTITDFDFQLSKKDEKRFYRVFCVPLSVLTYSLWEKSYSLKAYTFMNNIYYDLYRRYAPFAQRIKAYALMKLLRYKTGFDFVVWIRNTFLN